MNEIVRLKKINNVPIIRAVLSILLILSAIKLSARGVSHTLLMPNTPMSIKAEGFYITDVIDERTDKKIIASLVPISTNADKKKQPRQSP